ncbi:MAG: PLP-dependent transferase, partial [Rhodospirillales bacterium]|nr:PLP-dependent transferase [Rhodospirillales bacterium]
TKYIVGHSDAMLGLVTTTEEHWPRLKRGIAAFGHSAGSEECWLGLRGLRTLAVRLRQHQETGLNLARWLEARPEVAAVLHPALPSHPGHALWKRDFSGASGLFGVILKPFPKEAVAAMLDGLRHFAMGFSWGGYESLIIPSTGLIQRSAIPWAPAGPSLRIHAGLEDVEDLKRDLEAGFERLRTALLSPSP